MTTFDYELKEREYAALKERRKQLYAERDKYTKEIVDIDKALDRIAYDWDRQLHSKVVD